MTSFLTLFMGHSPKWYKLSVALALILNPIFLYIFGSFITGWIVLFEFIAILALALQAYPLFPGGLLALEILVLKMAPLEMVMKEIHTNIDVIMLLLFMVPAIFFMKPLLMWIFLQVFSKIKNKITLSMLFLILGAFLSAWLDALTVVAVMITVCGSIHEVKARMSEKYPEEAEEFNGFLRNLLMHGAIGTALGGVSTLIGEPQNILIAHYAGWGFNDFYLKMAHFSIPLQIAGILICWGLEHFRCKMFGFGYQLPPHIRMSLEHYTTETLREQTQKDLVQRIILGAAFVSLILALAFQLAPIGIIGLGLLICLPVLTGQTDEHTLGKSFGESMPFASLLVVFFVIVAMIDALGLFQPITSQALQFNGKGQMYSFFMASGILSSVSDNVFVATIYIHQAYNAMTQGVIDKIQFDQLALMINVGTNIFSIITPNGQAAFLFLLTSAMARLIGLSYIRMLLMAFPYAVGLVLLSLALV